MTTKCSARAGSFLLTSFLVTVGILALVALFGGADGSDVGRAVSNAGAGLASNFSAAAVPTAPSIENIGFQTAVMLRSDDSVGQAVGVWYERLVDGGGVAFWRKPAKGVLDFEPAASTSANARADETEDNDKFLLSGSQEFIQIAAGDSKGRATRKRGGLTILQIGDSHTAADFFTGEIRKILQARYGNGGPGYIEVGKPHPGVRSAALNVSASLGWTYSARQNSSGSVQFYLSGFDATATHGGETLSFIASNPTPYDRIEIEVTTGPNYGAIDIAIDNLPPVRRTLARSQQGRIVFGITREARKKDTLSRLVITTLDDRPVTISSVGILNKGHGVSYSNVGFTGATIDIVNKFDPKMLDDELKRLAPQIVVLAFGTNEGFNDDLDLGHYRDLYLTVIQKIRSSLPDAQIIMVGPPHANRVPSSCIKDSQSAVCKAARGGGETDQPLDCPYSTPPNLDNVREVQKGLAKQENIPFWDWSSIMQAKCGAHSWVIANPRLMTHDYVHFTIEGYKISANAFSAFLSHVVIKFRNLNYAIHNY